MDAISHLLELVSFLVFFIIFVILFISPSRSLCSFLIEVLVIVVAVVAFVAIVVPGDSRSREKKSGMGTAQAFARDVGSRGRWFLGCPRNGRPRNAAYAMQRVCRGLRDAVCKPQSSYAHMTTTQCVFSHTHQ